MGCGVWGVVCCVWCVVSGVWCVGCVVCGVWCVVCGVWGVGCGVYFHDAVFEALGTQLGAAPLQTDLTINLTAALRTLLQQEDRWGGPRTELRKRERKWGGDGATGVGDLWGGGHARSRMRISNATFRG